MIHFHRELSIETYFSTYAQSHWITFPNHYEPSETKSAMLNLTIVKQVKIFAVIFPGQSTWRYFATPKTCSTVLQMYKNYSKRWAVETVHQVLKDILGLDEGKMRLEPLVEGHIFLVYLIHFYFLKYHRYLEKDFLITLTPYQLYDHVRSTFPVLPDPIERKMKENLKEMKK